MRRAVLLAALALAGCVGASPHAELARAEPAFDPIAFFAGETRGAAELKVIFKAPVPVHVIGHGTVAPDGNLTLVQDVTQGSEPSKQREWQLRRVAPDRYTGTLTDAAGPVIADTAGNRLHIAYRQKDGLAVEQWLYLQPGGQVALNRMRVSKWGVAVAALAETITRR